MPRAENNPQRLPARKLIPVTIKQQESDSESSIQAHLQEYGSWRELANCRGKSHLMFPAKHKDISYIPGAKRLCVDCPVKEECLDFALTWPMTDMHGVWAGLTPRKLAKEQKDRGIVPDKPTIAQVWAGIARKERMDADTDLWDEDSDLWDDDGDDDDFG